MSRTKFADTFKGESPY